MKQIDKTDIELISGGFWPVIGGFAAGSIIGMGNYVFQKNKKQDEITVTGATMAGTIGGLSGGLGSIVTSAAGGGIAANIAWRPGFMAINAAGQMITAENK